MRWPGRLDQEGSRAIQRLTGQPRPIQIDSLVARRHLRSPTVRRRQPYPSILAQVVPPTKEARFHLTSELRVPLKRLHRFMVERGVSDTSASTIDRWLAEDAIRPWQCRSWIFPRDADFTEKAARMLDLYQGHWGGKLLEPGDMLICTDAIRVDEWAPRVIDEAVERPTKVVPASGGADQRVRSQRQGRVGVRRGPRQPTRDPVGSRAGAPTRVSALAQACRPRTAGGPAKERRCSTARLPGDARFAATVADKRWSGAIGRAGGARLANLVPGRERRGDRVDPGLRHTRSRRPSHAGSGGGTGAAARPTAAGHCPRHAV